MSLEARCRNCGNTGLDMFGKPCVCRYGKAVAQIVERARKERQPLFGSFCPDCGEQNGHKNGCERRGR